MVTMVTIEPHKLIKPHGIEPADLKAASLPVVRG